MAFDLSCSAPSRFWSSNGELSFGGVDFLRDLGFRLAEFDQDLGIGKFAFEIGQRVEPAADAGRFVENGARLLLIGPEGRTGHDILQFHQARALFVGVKDTSLTPRSVRGGHPPSF